MRNTYQSSVAVRKEQTSLLEFQVNTPAGQNEWKSRTRNSKT